MERSTSGDHTMSERTNQTSTFETWDGVDLFYRTWDPEDKDSKKAVILMHRGHEHSGRLSNLATGLDLPDFWAFGYDARGHGNSPGQRGYAADFGHLVKDLAAFVKFIGDKHNIAEENISIVANSVGAVVTAAWVHDYAPNIRSMVLVAPAFSIRLYVPLALPMLRLLNVFKKPAFISSYVKAKMLTHDAEEAKRYEQDSLITKDISVNVLIGLYDWAKRVVSDAGAITTPTMVLTAGKDWIVRSSHQRTFFYNLSSKVKKLVEFPKFFHGIIHEKDRAAAFAAAREFILDSFTAQRRDVFLLNADKKGHTKSEYESMKEDVSPLKAFGYRMTQTMMSTIGKLSNGVRMGLDTGFDSGESLDYIYRNKATGITPIGKIIDYFYLNAIGWKGIRIRKRHLDAALHQAIVDVIANNQVPRVLDIAAGPGRYVLEAMEKHAASGAEALLCDNSQRNIDAGKIIASEKSLKCVTFMRHDAFDPNSYNAMSFKPNIVVVSGLFELFPDNTLINRALAGISSIIADGATVIYTGQPWHPQLELIAHTLPNRDGEPWIMRRRSQAELNELFAHHGLIRHKTVVDN
jgi:alpha-beta hydrolase superfamily lysophospholipase/SAM-dependent methyltransferase